MFIRQKIKKKKKEFSPRAQSIYKSIRIVISEFFTSILEIRVNM